MIRVIISIVLLLACVAYLALDLYLEYKDFAEKQHEDVQELIKKQQEEE